MPGGATYAEIVKGAGSRSSSRGERPRPSLSPPELHSPQDLNEDEYFEQNDELSDVQNRDDQNNQAIPRVSVVIEPCVISERVEMDTRVYEIHSESEYSGDRVGYEEYSRPQTEIEEYYEPPVDYRESDLPTQMQLETSPEHLHDMVEQSRELQVPERDDRAPSPTRLRSQELSYAEILALGLRRQSKTHSVTSLPKPQVAHVELVKEIIVECVEKSPPVQHNETKIEHGDLKLKQYKPERPERPSTRSRSRDMPRQRRAPEKRPTKSHDNQIIKRKKTMKKVIEVQDFDETESQMIDTSTNPFPTKSDESIIDAVKSVTKKLQHSDTVVETVKETVNETDIEQATPAEEIEHKKKKKHKTKKPKSTEDEIQRALKEIEEHGKKKKKARDKDNSEHLESSSQIKDSELEKNVKENDALLKNKKKKGHKEYDKKTFAAEVKTDTPMYIIEDIPKDIKKKKKSKETGNDNLISTLVHTEQHIIGSTSDFKSLEPMDMPSWDSIPDSELSDVTNKVELGLNQNIIEGEQKTDTNIKYIKKQKKQKHQKEYDKNTEKLDDSPEMLTDQLKCNILHVTELNKTSVVDIREETEQKFSSSTVTQVLSDTNISDNIIQSSQVIENNPIHSLQNKDLNTPISTDTEEVMNSGKEPKAEPATVREDLKVTSEINELRSDCLLEFQSNKFNQYQDLQVNKEVETKIKKKRKNKNHEKSPEHIVHESIIEADIDENIKVIEPIIGVMPNVVEQVDEQKQKKKKLKKENLEEKVKNVDFVCKQSSDMENITATDINLTSKTSQEKSEIKKYKKKSKSKLKVLDDKETTPGYITENVETLSPLKPDISVEEKSEDVKSHKKKKLKKPKGIDDDDIERALREIERTENFKKKSKEKVVKLKDKKSNSESIDKNEIEPKSDIRVHITKSDTMQSLDNVKAVEHVDWNKLLAEEQSIPEVIAEPITLPEPTVNDDTEQIATEVTILKEISDFIHQERTTETINRICNQSELDQNKEIKSKNQLAFTVSENPANIEEQVTITEYKDSLNEARQDCYKEQSTSRINEQNNNDKFFKDGSINIVEEITRYEPIAQDIETRTIYLITHEEKKLPPIRTVKIFSSKSNSLEEETNVTGEKKIPEPGVGLEENLKSYSATDDVVKEDTREPVVMNTAGEDESKIIKHADKITYKKSSIEKDESRLDIEESIEGEIDTLIDKTSEMKESSDLLITDSESNHETIHGVIRDEIESKSITEDNLKDIVEQAIFGSVQDRNKVEKRNKKSHMPYQELINEVKTYSLDLDTYQLDYDYYQFVLNKRDEFLKNIPKIDSSKDQENVQLSEDDIKTEHHMSFPYENKPTVEIFEKGILSNKIDVPSINYQEIHDAEFILATKNENKESVETSKDLLQSDNNVEQSQNTTESEHSEVPVQIQEYVTHEAVQKSSFKLSTDSTPDSLSNEIIDQSVHDEVDFSKPLSIITTEFVSNLTSQNTVTTVTSITTVTSKISNDSDQLTTIPSIGEVVKKSKISESDNIVGAIETESVSSRLNIVPLRDEVSHHSYYELLDAEKYFALSKSKYNLEKKDNDDDSQNNYKVTEELHMIDYDAQKNDTNETLNYSPQIEVSGKTDECLNPSNNISTIEEENMQMQVNITSKTAVESKNEKIKDTKCFIWEAPRHSYQDIIDAERQLIITQQQRISDKVSDQTNIDTAMSVPSKDVLIESAPCAVFPEDKADVGSMKNQLLFESPSINYQEISDAECILATTNSREESEESSPITEDLRPLDLAPSSFIEDEVVALNNERQNHVNNILSVDTLENLPTTNGIVIGPLLPDSVETDEVELTRNIESDLVQPRESYNETPRFIYHELREAETLLARYSQDRITLSQEQVIETREVITPEKVLHVATDDISNITVNTESTAAIKEEINNEIIIKPSTQPNIGHPENMSKIYEQLTHNYHELQDAECILGLTKTLDHLSGVTEVTQNIINETDDIVSQKLEIDNETENVNNTLIALSSDFIDSEKRSIISQRDQSDSSINLTKLQHQEIDFSFEVDDLSNTPIAVEYGKEDSAPITEPIVQFYVETPTPTKEANFNTEDNDKEIEATISPEAEDFEIVDVEEFQVNIHSDESRKIHLENVVIDNMSKYEPDITNITTIETNARPESNDDEHSFEIVNIDEDMDLTTKITERLESDTASPLENFGDKTGSSTFIEDEKIDLSFIIDDIDQSLVPSVFGTIEQVENAIKERESNKPQINADQSVNDDDKQDISNNHPKGLVHPGSLEDLSTDIACANNINTETTESNTKKDNSAEPDISHTENASNRMLEENSCTVCLPKPDTISAIFLDNEIQKTGAACTQVSKLSTVNTEVLPLKPNPISDTTESTKVLDTDNFIINEQIDSIMTEASSSKTSHSPNKDVSPVETGESITSKSSLSSEIVFDKTESIDAIKSPIHSLHDLLPAIDSIPEFKPSFANTVLYSKLSADAPEFTPSYMYKSTTVSTSDPNEPEEILTITREVSEIINKTQRKPAEEVLTDIQENVQSVAKISTWISETETKEENTSSDATQISEVTSECEISTPSYSSASNSENEPKQLEHISKGDIQDLDTSKIDNEDRSESKIKRNKKKKKSERKDILPTETLQLHQVKSDVDDEKLVTDKVQSDMLKSEQLCEWIPSAEEGKSYADVLSEGLYIDENKDSRSSELLSTTKDISQVETDPVTLQQETPNKEEEPVSSVGSEDSKLKENIFPKIVEEATDAVDAILEKSECVIGSWAKIVGSKRPSTEERSDTVNIHSKKEEITEKVESHHKTPMILVDESDSEQHKIDIEVDAEGFIKVDRRRSRSRSRETTSKLESKLEEKRERSENRFEPLTSTLKPDDIEPTSSQSEEEKPIKKEKGRKSRCSKSRDKELRKEIPPSTSDEDKKPLKKDKKKRSSKSKEMKLEVEPVKEEAKVEVKLESESKKKNKKKKKDKKVDAPVTDTPSPLDVTSSEQDQSKIKIKNVTPISTPESVQTPVKDRFYSEAQYWKVDPSIVGNIEEFITVEPPKPKVSTEKKVNKAKATQIGKTEIEIPKKAEEEVATKISSPAFQHRPGDKTHNVEKQFVDIHSVGIPLEHTVSKFIPEEIKTLKTEIKQTDEKIREELSLESKMADLQREIEEMLLPENDSILSDDSPKELTDTQISDYQYDEVMDNITPSLATPESEVYLEKCIETPEIDKRRCEPSTEKKKEEADQNKCISSSIVDSLLDDTDPSSATDTLDYTSITVDDEFILPKVDKDTVVQIKTIETSEAKPETLTVFEPTNTDTTNLSNLQLDNFWTEKSLTDDAELLLIKTSVEIPKYTKSEQSQIATEPIIESLPHVSAKTIPEDIPILDSKFKYSSTGLESIKKSTQIECLDENTNIEINIVNDNSFWPEKHLYHDAECQYFLLMASKNKPSSESETVLKLSDPTDKDKDPGGSSGHSSEAEEPKEHRGSGSFDSSYISMDLPGGICSWKDQTSYLSCETPAVTAEDILTTCPVVPLAPSPALQEPDGAQPTPKVIIQSYRTILHFIFYVWHDIFTKFLISHATTCLVRCTAARRSSCSANSWRAQ